MHFSVVCAEDVPRLRLGRRQAGQRLRHATSPRFYERLCAAWPRGEVPAAFYSLPHERRRRCCVLSGGLDPATPPRHGERVAAALGPMARHVVVANAGHGVMAIGCMRDVDVPLRRCRRRCRRAGGRRRLRGARAAAAGVPCPRAAQATASEPAPMIEVAALAKSLRRAGAGRRRARRLLERPRAAARERASTRSRRQLRRARRPHHRPARPERRRQDDDAAHARRR